MSNSRRWKKLIIYLSPRLFCNSRICKACNICIYDLREEINRIKKGNKNENLLS